MSIADNNVLSVVRVVEGTSVDGPGLRTSVYLAGCHHHCAGCQNPQTWDIRAGHPMTVDEIFRIIDLNRAPMTLSGGDPLEQPEPVATLLQRVRQELNRNIWVYTGYHWEDIVSNAPLLQAVRHADVVVDGPYVAAERDATLPFRGSGNQRLIDVRASLLAGHAVLYALPWTL